MAEASAAVERRKASASRWTRGRAQSAIGWQHPLRGEAPRDSCAFSALRLPLFFWRQKICSFCRQNSDAMRRENEAACTIRPRASGGGGPLELAQRANVVEGAPDSELRCRCRAVNTDEIDSRGARNESSSSSSAPDLASSKLRCGPRPFHHPAAQGGPPSPLSRGRMQVGSPPALSRGRIRLRP